MTIGDMVFWFDTLQDKFGTAYFTDDEKSAFINRAQIEFVEELFDGDNKRKPNIELSQDTIAKIAPLIYELPYFNMSSTGAVTKSAIQAALTNIDANAIVWRPLSIGWMYGSITKPVSYTRHNDRWQFEANAFKKATIKSPKVRETYNSYMFLPISTTPRIYFTVLKYPKEVDVAGVVDSDMPDHTHNRIVAIALEFAGVGSRDVMLTQLMQRQLNNGEK